MGRRDKRRKRRKKQERGRYGQKSEVPSNDVTDLNISMFNGEDYSAALEMIAEKGAEIIDAQLA